MPITRLSHKGKSWPIEKFVQACLNGDCDFPAPIAATIIKNMRDYDNHGTVSGSQLYSECDYSRMLERLDYTAEISNQFYATYRGSNVHATIEQCKKDPAFKDWVFEKRFFAVLKPDDSLERLDVPTGPDGEPDWDAFQVICDDLRAKGYVILSGALDAYDGKAFKIHDWKTSKLVGDFTEVKEAWQQQMNMYTILAELNGYRVDSVRITIMDATTPVIRDVPRVNEAAWIPSYFIPRVRQLASLQKYTKQDIQDINDGIVDAPPGFPVPVVNYLCEGRGRDKKIYCPSRENGACPVWRKSEAIKIANQAVPA